MTYRPEIPAPTERIARLPVHRGYPVPWFVAWVDSAGKTLERGEGEPEFRVLARGAVEEAYAKDLCWICGEPRSRYAAFVVGPMCALNRTSAEPPSHPECAGWAACACPFLVRPYARRRDAGLPAEVTEPAGVMLKRNPGVALVWASDDWRPFVAPKGGVLFHMGTPKDIAWFAHGRKAKRDEVEASIASGLPALVEIAERQGARALAELERRRRTVLEVLAPA